MKDLLLYVHVVVKTLNLEVLRCHLTDHVKVRAARTSLLFFLVQHGNQSLISWFVVAVSVVVSETPYSSNGPQMESGNIGPAIGPFLIYCHIYCNMKGTCFPDMRKILATDEMYKRNNVFYSLSFCQCAGKTQRGRVPCISLNSCCSSASWTWISSGNFEKVLFLLAFLFICCCCWCLSLISRLLGGNSVNDH